MLGSADVTKIVVRKNVMAKIALGYPEMVAEFNETVRLMSAKKPKKKCR
jgi:hypothetical protein